MAEGKKGTKPSTQPARDYTHPLNAPAGKPPKKRSASTAVDRAALPPEVLKTGHEERSSSATRHRKKPSQHLRQVVGLIRRGPDETAVVRKTTSLRLDAISSEVLTLHALQRRVTKNTLISDIINGWLYIATDYAQALFAQNLPRGARAAIVPERWPGYLASLGFVSARQDSDVHDVPPEVTAARGSEPAPEHTVPPPGPKRGPGGDYIGKGPGPQEIPHAPPPPQPARPEGIVPPQTKPQTVAEAAPAAQQDEPAAEPLPLRVGFGNAAQRMTEGRGAPQDDAITEFLKPESERKP